MKKLGLFCALISIPAFARADVMLEYWGSVNWTISGNQSEGDAVYGSMRIADLYTPRDWHPDPLEGAYNWNDQSCETDCVWNDAPSAFMTDGSALVGQSHDHAWAKDGTAMGGGVWDSFGAQNVEFAGDDRIGHYLSFSAPIDFVLGQGLAQSFDLDIAASGGLGDFMLHDSLAGVQTFFGALLSRVRVSTVSEQLQTCRAT